MREGSSSNHTMQRMPASRLCQSRIERVWRLARTADGVRWTKLSLSQREDILHLFSSALGGAWSLLRLDLASRKSSQPLPYALFTAL